MMLLAKKSAREEKTMKRAFLSLLLTSILLSVGAVPVLADPGGDEEEFNAETYIKQAIVALDQRQPNTGVIDAKLKEVVEQQEEAEGVDIAKVEQAMSLVLEKKYGEASQALFQSIGEDPEGENPELGSPLQEYEKEYTANTRTSLLLVVSVLFAAIGVFILKKSDRR